MCMHVNYYLLLSLSFFIQFICSPEKENMDTQATVAYRDFSNGLQGSPNIACAAMPSDSNSRY